MVDCVFISLWIPSQHGGGKPDANTKISNYTRPTIALVASKYLLVESSVQYVAWSSLSSSSVLCSLVCSFTFHLSQHLWFLTDHASLRWVQVTAVGGSYLVLATVVVDMVQMLGASFFSLGYTSSNILSTTWESTENEYKTRYRRQFLKTSDRFTRPT